MDTLQLKYFIAVAECENITIAANRLYVSQSSLSRTISNLEKSIGVKLFNRTGNTIALNGAGKIFLETAYQTCTLLENGVNLSRSFFDNEKLVRFSVPTSSFLSPFLEKFLLDNLDIKMTRITQNHSQMIESLIKKEVDFAMSYEPLVSDLIDWTPLLLEEKYFVMVSKFNPLANLKTITLKQLVEERLIFGEYIYGSRIDTFYLNDAFFRATGSMPHILLNGGDISLSSKIVENNAAVFIYPLSSNTRALVTSGNKDDRRSYTVLPLEDDFISRELGIATLKGATRSTATQSLLDSIKAHFASGAAEDNVHNFSFNYSQKTLD